MMGDRIVVERVVWPSGGVASTAVSLDSPVMRKKGFAATRSPCLHRTQSSCRRLLNRCAGTMRLNNVTGGIAYDRMRFLPARSHCETRNLT